MPQSLLIVEGQDDLRLCSVLLGVQDQVVIREAAKHSFTPKLKAILIELQQSNPLSMLAIVRDADDSASRSFESVCSSIRGAGLHPPNEHAQYSDGEIPVGVFIMPDGESNGAIEALCIRSIEKLVEAQCVREYLECLKENRVLHSNDIDKSFVHAFLAAQTNPLLRVGETAQRRIWDPESPAFGQLRVFLNKLL